MLPKQQRGLSRASPMVAGAAECWSLAQIRALTLVPVRQVLPSPPSCEPSVSNPVSSHPRRESSRVVDTHEAEESADPGRLTRRTLSATDHAIRTQLSAMTTARMSRSESMSSRPRMTATARTAVRTQPSPTAVICSRCSDEGSVGYPRPRRAVRNTSHDPARIGKPKIAPNTEAVSAAPTTKKGPINTMSTRLNRRMLPACALVSPSSEVPMRAARVRPRPDVMKGPGHDRSRRFERIAEVSGKLRRHPIRKALNVSPSDHPHVGPGATDAKPHAVSCRPIRSDETAEAADGLLARGSI